MKKLAIFIVIWGLITSCTPNIVSNISKVEGMELTADLKCRYYTYVYDEHQENTMNHTYFIDSCNKFKIGDTIQIVKKQ